jgi:hypothetical protein
MKCRPGSADNTPIGGAGEINPDQGYGTFAVDGRTIKSPSWMR